MVLVAKNKSAKTIMELTNEAIKLEGYVLYENDVFVDKGWFHFALVGLLNKYGVHARAKKWQSIYSVANDVLNNKLVIVSVTVPGRRSISEDGEFGLKKGGTTGGHLLLIVGVKVEKGEVIGFYVHDPRGLPQYQEKTWISAKNFTRIFSGRTIATL
jgi:hypothetical protein